MAFRQLRRNRVRSVEVARIVELGLPIPEVQQVSHLDPQRELPQADIPSGAEQIHGVPLLLEGERTPRHICKPHADAANDRHRAKSPLTDLTGYRRFQPGYQSRDVRHQLPGLVEGGLGPAHVGQKVHQREELHAAREEDRVTRGGPGEHVAPLGFAEDEILVDLCQAVAGLGGQLHGRAVRAVLVGEPRIDLLGPGKGRGLVVGERGGVGGSRPLTVARERVEPLEEPDIQRHARVQGEPEALAGLARDPYALSIRLGLVVVRDAEAEGVEAHAAPKGEALDGPKLSADPTGEIPDRKVIVENLAIGNGRHRTEAQLLRLSLVQPKRISDGDLLFPAEQLLGDGVASSRTAG